MEDYQTVETIEELEQLQGTPGRLASHKVIPYLDDNCQKFIHHSPFAVLSTSSSSGMCDSSPRGDASGFVHILDDRHLLLPERMGNRRMDSMRNLIENPGIGLLFIIPGLKETLRINGTAKIIKDPHLMKQLEANGHIPNVGILVRVEECFIHCAKSIHSSQALVP